MLKKFICAYNHFINENIVETIKKHFKGSVQKDLLNILYTSIELKNISKIYRYKQYFHESEDSIRSSLFLQYSRLPKDMMNRLISASGPKEVLSLLSTSKYNFYMDDKEFAYIEYYADSIQYNIAKRYMRFSNSAPLVYMTYSIKCACSNNYNTYLTAVDKCRNILWKELARINYKYLFIFGDAYRSISDNPIPRFIATGGKYVFSNYSPLIKFKDDNLYHIFKQRFADDINWVNENRNNYGINFIND